MKIINFDRRNVDNETWNKKLSQLPHANITQLYEWAEAQEIGAKSKSKIIWIFHDDGLLQARRERFCLTGRHIYIPLTYIKIGDMGGGPCFKDVDVLYDMLNELPFSLRTHIFIPEDYGITELKRFKRKKLYNWILDLTTPDDVWKNSFEKETRNMVRQAIRKDVTVGLARKNEFSDYIALKIATTKRIGYKPSGDELQKTGYLYSQDWVDLWAARKDGVPIAFLWISKYGDTIYYNGPVSGEIAFKSRANNLLVWEMIKHYCDDYNKFNFWGIIRDKSDSTYGVTRFKKSFGGREEIVYDFYSNL